ncbi:unnamed protein product [Rotaria sp. Silwood1]|nr:unnamed protein product [Rotaria sp. Silwood1]
MIEEHQQETNNQIFRKEHRQQELIGKILRLENRTKFINISKEGYLDLWTRNLHLEKTTYSAADELNDGTSSNVSGIGQNRRRVGMWVTDAIYMPDTHKLVLASTSIKNVPTCLEYYPNTTSENSQSALIFGDDCTFIHILFFLNSISSPFDPVRRKSDLTKSDKSPANSIQRICLGC